MPKPIRRGKRDDEPEENEGADEGSEPSRQEDGEEPRPKKRRRSTLSGRTPAEARPASSKKLVIAIVAVLAIVGAGAFFALSDSPEEPPEWTDVAADGGYKVSFPGKPKFLEAPPRGPGDSGPQVTNAYECWRRRRGYSTGTIEMPADAITLCGTEDAALDWCVDVSCRGFKGTRVYSKPITVGGHAGREFQVVHQPQKPNLRGTMRTTAQVFLVKNRFLEALVVGPEGDARSSEDERFFESFKVAGG